MTNDRALLPFDEGDGRLIRRQWHEGQQSGIYQIRNRHTGRVYIGKSRDIPSRWLAHYNALDRGLHVNDALQGDWEVYGKRAFGFTVLEEVSGLQALQNAEARHLAAASDVYNVAQVFEWKGHYVLATQPLTPRRFLELLYDDPLPDWHIFSAVFGIRESTLGGLKFRLLDEPDGAARDFAEYQDWGYCGLYNGETARDIAARKGLAKGERIHNWMGPHELAANLFHITQTEAKLQRKGITDKAEANQIHFEIGAAVRRVIIEQGTTLPEQLPTPDVSFRERQCREQKRLEAERQPSLFDEPTEA